MSKEWANTTIRRFVLLMLLTAVSVLIRSAPVMAQAPQKRLINTAMKAEIIDSVCAALDEIYVFPDVAQKMGDRLRKGLQDKKYADINDPDEFAEIITGELREISNDKHLGARAMTPEMVERYSQDELTDEALKEELERMKYKNFNFVKVERLDGNVGYLKFNGFVEADKGGATAVAAINFLNHVDALIIDLRDNGGGSPSMIQLITSYFFDEAVHLNSFYIRKEDSIKQFWTQAHVQGEKMADVDLYVLTSDYTFSGAEEFTYNLKNLERATIIGETTGGGAHPVTTRMFPNLLFGVRVPFGRAINPISGTNWEGTGVTPHIEVPADQALDVAYLEALKGLNEKTDREDLKFGLQWAIDGLKIKMNPVTVDEKILRSYVGVYGPRTITFENGKLYYQREDRPQMEMIPMAEDLFGFEKLDYFRLKVIRDDKGNAIELHGTYDNGYIDKSPRTDG